MLLRELSFYYLFYQATSSRLQKDYSRGWSIEGSLPPIDVTVPDISVKHVMEGGKGMEKYILP